MTIVDCPKCREQVTVPAGVHVEAQVRCPLCLEQYLLATALDHLPPRLVVVHDLDDDESLEPATVTGEIGLHTGESAGGDKFSAISRDEWAADSSAATFQFKEPPLSMVRTPQSIATATRTRTRRKHGSPVKAASQVVGGGVLGLMIAQLILWWMPGQWGPENRDPLKLAQHVSNSRLAFLVPNELRRDSSPPPLFADASGTGSHDPQPDSSPETDSGDKSESNPGADAVDATDPSFSQLPSGTEIPGVPLGNQDAEPVAKSQQTPGSTAAALPPAPIAVVDSGSEPEILDAPDAARLEPPRIPAAPEVSVNHQEVVSKQRPPGVAGQPAPDKKGASKPAHGIRIATRMDAREIGNLLTRLDAAELAWDTMPISTTKDVKKALFGEFYDSIAKVGEATVFVDGGDPYHDSQFSALRRKLETLINQPYKLESAQPNKIELIGRYAAFWLDQKNDHSGVAIYGTVLTQERRGELLESRIKLPINDREVNVVLRADGERQLPINTMVFVLGTVVTDPQQNVEGYVGSSTAVIVPGYHIVGPSL